MSSVLDAVSTTFLTIGDSVISWITLLMLGSLIPPLLGKNWVKVFNMLILISPNKATMAVVNPEIEKKLVKSYKAMKRLSPKTNARNFLKK